MLNFPENTPQEDGLRRADYNDEFTTYQEILSALGDKADITSTIYVVNTLTGLEPTNYEDGQMILAKDTKKLYIVSSGSFTTYYDIESELSEKLDKKTTIGTYVYTHTGSTQSETLLQESPLPNTVPLRNTNGEIMVVMFQPLFLH